MSDLVAFFSQQVESFRRSRLGMEAALLSRDKVGVQDFVLLEDYTNIDAFLDNLRKRFQENLIYVSMIHWLYDV